jgi:hypothetical protein
MNAFSGRADMLKRSSSFVVGLFVLLLSPVIASAQWTTSGPDWKQPVSSFLGEVTTSLSPAKINAAVRQRRPRTRTANSSASTPAAARGARSLLFTPIGNSGVDRELVNSLTAKADEREALLTVLRATKKAYEDEVKKVGKSNNIAAALTFFIATCVTVYNDAAEPSDAASENLMAALSELMAATPEIAGLSNGDKQNLHDRLVYLSGLILAGYINGKQTNDEASLVTFRLLAGACLQSVLQIEPQRLHFEETGLVIQ